MSASSAAAFASLPLELLLQIVSYLPPPRSKYAAVCSAFLPAVESITFRKINLDSPDLPRFPAMFARTHRRRALRHLTFSVFLPAEASANGVSWDTLVTYIRKYVTPKKARAAAEETQRRNYAMFTAAVQQLLRELASWDVDKAGITLTIRPINALWRARNKVDGRWAGTQLPVVNSVAALYISVPMCEKGCCDPDVVVEAIPGSVPRLRTAHWYMGPDTVRNVRLRQEMRSGMVLPIRILIGLFKAKDFARILTGLQLPNLTMLSIEYKYRYSLLLARTTPPSEDIPQAGISTIDPLSRALRNLTARCPCLKHFALSGRALVSPDLFWPACESKNRDDNATESPVWPCMEEYLVHMDKTTPAGECYYLPTLTGASCLRLDPAKFHPLLRAMSHAVGRMPRIRKFIVELNVCDASPGSSIAVVGAGPGVSVQIPPMDAEDGNEVRRWYVFVGRGAEWGAIDVEGDVRVMWENWVGHEGVVKVINVQHPSSLNLLSASGCLISHVLYIPWGGRPPAGNEDEPGLLVEVMR
ncbi:hypothetical protein BDZ91DRAFT_768276 [Kalaharituber pfeilii]|nr:hypothetical protein BDZ91DRAFT_768276 [Kalaharituber pfeilii]